MKFKQFAEILLEFENLNSRNEITIKLAEFLKKLEGDELKYSMYFLLGRLAPKFLPIEFNFSSKLILAGLNNVFDPEKVKQISRETGDMGSTIEELIAQKESYLSSTPSLLDASNNINFTDQNLEIVEVYKMLLEITESSGKGSQEDKINKYLAIVSKSDSLSAKYITRIILGTLRLGVSDKTILDSISWAISGDKSVRKTLDYIFGVRADIGEITQLSLSFKTKEDFLEGIKHISVKPGVPMASKLVERESNSAAVWTRMPNPFVQPKLDGLRGQIHFDGTTGFIFSRNMENMTDQFPEIIESIKNLKVESIILDSEIIGFVDKTQSYMTYQETMQRRRKYDVETYSKDIPVKAMCFDILYLNGKDLTLEPIEERLKRLKELVGQDFMALKMLETIQMNSPEELEEYYKSKVENGLEGIIIKEQQSIYEPGTRNYKWIKLKANSRSDLVDTIDVAILGYYYGEGARAKSGFGAMLAGVYDPETEKYYSIGKVGSGFKDDEMLKMFTDMNELSTSEKPANFEVVKSLYPDVWILPKIVAEIDADEITRSPSHQAAIGVETNVKNDDKTKGLSIRFPRMKIWRRDKDFPNTVAEIVRMYELRKNIQNS